MLKEQGLELGDLGSNPSSAIFNLYDFWPSFLNLSFSFSFIKYGITSSDYYDN